MGRDKSILCEEMKGKKGTELWRFLLFIMEVFVLTDYSSSLSRISSALEGIYSLLKADASRDMSFEEARHKLFHSKSRDWIRFYIIDRHPEILTSRGGWLTDSHGKGSRVIVTDSLRAKLWLMQATDIDWSQPEPKSLAI